MQLLFCRNIHWADCCIGIFHLQKLLLDISPHTILDTDKGTIGHLWFFIPSVRHSTSVLNVPGFRRYYFQFVFMPPELVNSISYSTIGECLICLISNIVVLSKGFIISASPERRIRDKFFTLPT